MRNINENLFISTPSSNLYCVWVAAGDEGHGGLRAIWIDRAMAVFIPDGTGIAATCFTGYQEEDLELAAGEHLPSIPTPHG